MALSVAPSRKRSRQDDSAIPAANHSCSCECNGVDDDGNGTPVFPASFDTPLRPPRLPVGTVATRHVAVHGCGQLATSKSGYLLYIAVTQQNVVKVLDERTGQLSTFAGSGEAGCEDGVGAAASFNRPHGLALSSDDRSLYVTDSLSHQVRMIDVQTRQVSTLAGSGEAGCEDGIGGAASFHKPAGMAVSSDDRTLFVTDFGSHKVRTIDVQTRQVSTLAGSGEEESVDAIGAAASFYHPQGVALTGDDRTLFVTDCNSHKVRMINVQAQEVLTFAGSGQAGCFDGIGTGATFLCPMDLALSRDDQTLFVADYGSNKLRAIDVQTLQVRTLAGSGEAGASDGVGATASFDHPCDLALSGDGATLFVTDSTGLRTVSVTPPGPLPLGIEIPPSTFSADMCKTYGGDGNLPQGTVTFVVGTGPAQRHIKNVIKAILCVRSDYFSNMFRAGTDEATAAEMELPNTDPAAFHSLVKYLLTDQLHFNAGAEEAMHLLQLARQHRVRRLELLVAKAAAETMAADTVLPLLESAHTTGDNGLLQRCRWYVLAHSGVVGASGTVEQLTDLAVAKGLLRDALLHNGELQGCVDQLRGVVEHCLAASAAAASAAASPATADPAAAAAAAAPAVV